jgi:putative SOS response-associated peptidase YedK
MCGRYDLSDSPAAIRARFSVPAVPEFTANPDVRPTQSNPIVRLARDGASRECTLARWGLVPAWAKEMKFGNRCINARAETIDRLPAFRAAYRKRRCLVPVNAFYEWSGPTGHKTRWRVGLVAEPLFALAGLWEWWQDPAAGEGVETYTVVTTAANAALTPIHDRMPVIVAPKDYALWLDPTRDPAELLAPAPAQSIAIAPC